MDSWTTFKADSKPLTSDSSLPDITPNPDTSDNPSHWNWISSINRPHEHLTHLVLPELETPWTHGMTDKKRIQRQGRYKVMVEQFAVYIGHFHRTKSMNWP